MNKGLNSGISGPDNGPKVQASTSTAVSMTTSTFTDLPMDTIDSDNCGGGQLVKASGNLLITKDGMYQLTAQGGFAANGTGIRVSELFITYADGGTLQFADGSGPASAAAVTGVFVTGAIRLHKGDRVKLRQWQNSGGALNTAGGFISYAWIGP